MTSSSYSKNTAADEEEVQDVLTPNEASFEEQQEKKKQLDPKKPKVNTKNEVKKEEDNTNIIEDLEDDEYDEDTFDMDKYQVRFFIHITTQL